MCKGTRLSIHKKEKKLSIERDSQTTQVWNYKADFLKTMINILNNLQVNMDDVDEAFQE